MLKPEILIIEDEEDIRLLIEGVLQDEGYNTRSSESGVTGLRLLRDREPSLIILDVWLGTNERDGIEILDQIKKQYPFLPVVMISGHSTIEKAVLSIKKGADDFLEKPFQIDKLLHVINRCLETRKLRSIANERYFSDPAQVILLGQSECAFELRKAVQDHSKSDTRILISGPAGSGKDYLARIIHNNSERYNNHFIRLNIGNLKNLEIESHLFGLEIEGEEITRRSGLLEQSHLSSLFIDEVVCIPQILQKKLVEFLLSGYFKRAGGTEKVYSNIRLFAGTSYDDMDELKKHLRDDFFSLLNVDCITCRPLRRRKEDIPEMVEFLIRNRCENLGVSLKKITPQVLELFSYYEWPGNIHELKVIIEWMILAGENCDYLSIEHLPRGLFKNIDMDLKKLPLRQARENFEREYLQYYFDRHDANVNEISKLIGMDRTALYRKMRALKVVEK